METIDMASVIIGKGPGQPLGHPAQRLPPKNYPIFLLKLFQPSIIEIIITYRIGVNTIKNYIKTILFGR